MNVRAQKFKEKSLDLTPNHAFPGESIHKISPDIARKLRRIWVVILGLIRVYGIGAPF